MKRYVFEFVIEEANDEFCEDINSRGVTGCDEVTEIVLNVFENEFNDVKIKLIRFEDKE